MACISMTAVCLSLALKASVQAQIWAMVISVMAQEIMVWATMVQVVMVWATMAQVTMVQTAIRSMPLAVLMLTRRMPLCVND